jgi:hypothetical protein
MEIPKLRSVWKHKEKESYYRVILITNVHTTRPEEFPVTICYQDVHLGYVWSRPLQKWLERVEEISETFLNNGKAQW